MPIEFRCTQCDRLLRTPDGTSGKDAKCPQCGAVVKIPSVSSPTVTPETIVPPPAPQVAPPFRETLAAGEAPNPYQSPVAVEMRAATGEVQRGFRPTRIDLGTTLGTAWQIYKDNFGKIVLGGLAVMFLTAVISGAVFYVLQDSPVATKQVANFLANIPSIWLSLGFFLFLIKIARGENPSFDVLFSAGRFLLPALGALVLMYVAIGVGLILLIIPGIIVALMLSQTFLMLIDQEAGVIDSLRMSAQATKGNKLTLFALGLVTMTIVALVTLLTCLLGYIFVVPFGSMVYVTAYLGMTGQGVAAR